MEIHFRTSQKFKIHHLETVSLLNINSQNKMDINKIQDLCNQDKVLKLVMEAINKIHRINIANSLKLFQILKSIQIQEFKLLRVNASLALIVIASLTRKQSKSTKEFVKRPRAKKERPST